MALGAGALILTIWGKWNSSFSEISSLRLARLDLDEEALLLLLVVLEDYFSTIFINSKLTKIILIIYMVHIL